ncbi:MAG: response regulator transcription factor [Verrucomicrobiia bacterium]
MSFVSIFIIADQAGAREGLRRLLAEGSNLNVVGDAEAAGPELARMGVFSPSVVLIDVHLPICALDATRRALAVNPAAHAVVLSGYAEDPKLASIVAEELRRAGASALLPKNIAAHDLVSAIQTVAAGRAIFPAHTRLGPEPPRVQGGARGPGAALTNRQTQVLTLVAQGLANKEIADRLSISPKTVEKHRQSVKEKLQTNNAADLTRRAVGLGLVQPI